MPQDPGMHISILLPNTLQDINVRAKTWCLTGDNIILIHPFLPDLTIVSILSKLQLLRCGSSGLMKGCALRRGQINPHGAAKVQGSPVAPGNTTSSRNAVWTKCCGLPTLTNMQQAFFLQENWEMNSDLLPVRFKGWIITVDISSNSAALRMAARFALHRRMHRAFQLTLSLSLSLSLSYTHTHTCARGSTNPISHDRCETWTGYVE